jgi:SAM-dependent methyltransferase
MRVEPYERYAEFYDRIGQRQFGQRLADALLADPRFGVDAVKTVVDLACGTGAGALRFAAAGKTVIGVDRSPQMLARAAASAERAGLHVEWIQQDLRELALPYPVDLAVSFYDSLNYIIEDGDLERIFGRVARFLRPGGRFVFDLNSKRRLAEGWGDATMVAADDDDLFVVYRSTWDDATNRSPLHLTAFVRDEAGNWGRFDEEHIERAYAIDDVTAMLTRTGFKAVEAREYHPWRGRIGDLATERSERLVFIAGLGQ